MLTFISPPQEALNEKVVSMTDYKEKGIALEKNCSLLKTM